MPMPDDNAQIPSREGYFSRQDIATV